MEKKLYALFDLQRFMKNEGLEKMISETEERFGSELSDDDLAFVSAAGENENGKDTVPDGEADVHEQLLPRSVTIRKINDEKRG